MTLVFSEREATELVSSTRWLKAYGLQSQKLNIQQVLPTIGFRHKRAHVPALNKDVSAVHSLGLFPVYKDTDGTLYNICAGEARLTGIECRLTNLITLYRNRLEWLTGRSQHVFGVVEESSIAVVVDRPDALDSTWEKLKNDLVTWSDELLSRITRVNMFWCGGSDIKQWHSEATLVTPLSINSLTDWLIDQLSTTASLSSNGDKTAVLEAVLMAMADKKVEAIYLVTNGNFLSAGEETFRRKVKAMRVQLNIVSYCCDDERGIVRLKDVAVMTGGRFHIYPSIQPHYLLSSLSERSRSSTSPPNDDSILSPPLSNRQPQSTTTQAICEDVQLLFDELQRGLNNLSEIRALCLEIAGQRKPILTDQDIKNRGSESGEKTEQAMSSKEWLAKHGLKAKKLRFYDLVSTISFRHCDGVVDIKEAPSNDGSDSQLVSHYKLVGAKYCGQFAHIRWLDGSVRHVFLSKFAFEQQKIKVTSLLELYKTRLVWLKRGSRELFGTVVEDQVIFLVDVSSSMENHLDIVKDRFEALLREQLKYKSKFNVIRFGSKAKAWRDRLTEVTPQTVHQALQWVHSLVAGGSTNVGDALQLALADRDVQAIYLLTDGRPDQLPESILGQMQRIPLIPIHTIAFNCDDSEANRFLTKLAALTGGRYHYYSDETRPQIEATQRYESEDCQLLREEIEQAEHDLRQIEELRAECAVLETKALPQKLSREKTRLGSTTPSGLESRSKSSVRETIRRSTAEANGHSSPVLKKQLSSKKLLPLTLSSKKWLKKHGLVAKRLTILHALEPTLIAHRPSHIPILNKDVVARVLDDVMPICHVSADGKEVHLVNPQAIDLNAYEENLGKTIALYERRLDQLVWRSISEEERERLGLSGEPPSFRTNREVLLECLDALDWPISKQDVTLLEEEINRGLVFMQQSRDLRKQSEMSGQSKGMLDGSLESDSNDAKRSTNDEEDGLEIKKAAKLLERYRGHQLIARDELMGLYFQGRALNAIDSHRIEVEFSDGQCQIVSVKHIFEVGGARPCPPLRPGQYVLCGTQGPLDRDRDAQWEICHYYVPGIVLASPSKTSVLYTVIDCFTNKIVAHRRQLLLISRTQYKFAVRYIRQCQSPTVGTDLFPAPEPQPIDIDFLIKPKPTEQTNISKTTTLSVQTDDKPDVSCHFLLDSATQTGAITVNASIQTESVNVEPLDDLNELLDLMHEVQGKPQSGWLKNKLSDLSKLIQRARKIVRNDMHRVKQQQQSDSRRMREVCYRLLNELRGDLGQLGEQQEAVVSEVTQVREEERQLSEKVAQTQQLLKDVLDRLHELETPVAPPADDLLHHVQEESANDQMLLIATGDQGFVVSREPLQAPIVETAADFQEDPMHVTVNSEVLARWPEDGWYYRVMVDVDCGDGTFLVDDGSGYQRRLPQCDLITDEQDGMKNITDQDCVVAMHPLYSYSFAPGVVKGASPNDWSLLVEFYDGNQASLNREYVYWLDPEKYSQDVSAIEQLEYSWVGQIVIARNDGDGCYYPAEVKEKISGGRIYKIQWNINDGTSMPPEVQDLRHLFGSLSTARQPTIGDRVLATYNQGQTYVPGWVAAIPTDHSPNITVNFCDGRRSMDIEESSCFWLSQDYYNEVVEYFMSKQRE